MRVMTQNCVCVVSQEEESVIGQGPRMAHAGIMAAATAIWRDLRAHRILPALLNIDDTDDEDNPEYDIGAGTSTLLSRMCTRKCCALPNINDADDEDKAKYGMEAGLQCNVSTSNM